MSIQSRLSKIERARNFMEGRDHWSKHISILRQFEILRRLSEEKGISYEEAGVLFAEHPSQYIDYPTPDYEKYRKRTQ